VIHGNPPGAADPGSAFPPLEFLVCDNYLNTNEILHQENYKSTNEISFKAASFYLTKNEKKQK